MPELKHTTRYTITDPKHLTTDFITDRFKKLNELKSPHCYNFTDVRREDKSIYIHYQNRHTSTLKEHINRGDLTEQQLFRVVWQVSKVMLECEEKKVNHLRLSPEAIAIKEVETGNGEEWFVWVKDFSFGRQFGTIEKGQELEHFQYMHPSFCLDLKASSFKQDQFHPIYDIWSLAVLIYWLVYKQSPFPDQKGAFSTETLKRYINNKFPVKYSNPTRKGINQFVKFCLTGKFSSWQGIKQYLIDKQGSVYSEIDFQVTPFQQICERHVKLMYLFSSIHTTIIQQCRHSDVNFWHERPKAQSFPFVTLIAEATLVIMNHIHSRFLQLYSAYSVLLPITSNLFEQVDVVTDAIKAELANYEELLLTHFQYKNTPPANQPTRIDQQLLALIQNHCIQVKLMSGVTRNRARIRYKTSDLSKIRKPSLYLQEDTSMMRPLVPYKQNYKSIDIIFDYCDAIIEIINQLKQNYKNINTLTELCHRSDILNEIVVYDFSYKTPLIANNEEYDSFLMELPLVSFKGIQSSIKNDRK